MKVKTYLNRLFEDSKELAYGQPNKAFGCAEQAYKIADELNLLDEKGYALFYMAYACRVNSEYTQGLKYAYQSYEILKLSHNRFGIYKVKNIIGIIYFYFGAYSEALENFMEALDLIHEEKDPNLESSVLNNIGEVYREAGDLEKALEYYEKAILISEENQLNFNIAAIRLNIGEIYYTNRMYEEAYQQVYKGYNIFKLENRILEQGEAETKLGRLMRVQCKFIEAKKLYKSAFENLSKIDNKYFFVELLIEMAYWDIDNQVNPIKNLKAALEISQDLGFTKKITAIYKMMSEHYQQNHEYKLALEYYKKYHLKLYEDDAFNLALKLETLAVEFEFFKENNEVFQYRKLTENMKREIEIANKTLAQIQSENQVLLKENLIDELTQLYNRRGIYNQFHSILDDKASIKGVLLIADVDRFKKYNDTWGHLSGDNCLIAISEILKNQPLEEYFAGRFGGEEFIVFFACNRYEDAFEVCEQLRKSVFDMGIKANFDDDQVVTISIGGVFGSIENEKLEDLIKQADIQLYIAKESGRNNVKVVKRED